MTAFSVGAKPNDKETHRDTKLCIDAAKKAANIDLLATDVEERLLSWGGPNKVKWLDAYCEVDKEDGVYFVYALQVRGETLVYKGFPDKETYVYNEELKEALEKIKLHIEQKATAMYREAKTIDFLMNQAKVRFRKGDSKVSVENDLYPDVMKSMNAYIRPEECKQ